MTDNFDKPYEYNPREVHEEPVEDHGLDKYELEWLLELIDHVAPRTYAYDSVRYKLRKLRYG